MAVTAKFITLAALAAAATFASIAPASAAGDAKAGKEYFGRVCAMCHTDTKGAPNKIGPNLWGVLGSKPGSVKGFNFSAAMKKANFTWTEDKLSAYLLHPQQLVPGNRMPYTGTPNKATADNVAAFLATLK